MLCCKIIFHTTRRFIWMLFSVYDVMNVFVAVHVFFLAKQQLEET